MLTVTDPYFLDIHGKLLGNLSENNNSINNKIKSLHRLLGIVKKSVTIDVFRNQKNSIAIRVDNKTIKNLKEKLNYKRIQRCATLLIKETKKIWWNQQTTKRSRRSSNSSNRSSLKEVVMHTDEATSPQVSSYRENQQINSSPLRKSFQPPILHSSTGSNQSQLHDLNSLKMRSETLYANLKKKQEHLLKQIQDQQDVICDLNNKLESEKNQFQEETNKNQAINKEQFDEKQKKLTTSLEEADKLKHVILNQSIKNHEEITSLKQKIEKLDSELKKEKETTILNSGIFIQQKGEISHLSLQLQHEKEKTKNLEGAITEEKESTQKMKLITDKLTDSISEKDRELQKASDSLQTLEKTKLDIENQLKILESEKTDYCLLLADYSDKIELEKNNVKTIKLTQNQKDTEIHNLKLQKANCEKTISDLKLLLENLDQKQKNTENIIQNLQMQLENTKTTCTETQENLATKIKEIDALNRRLEGNEQEQKALEEKLVKGELQQKDLEKTHAERIAQIEQAKKDLTNQIEQLTQQYLNEKKLSEETLEKTTTELSAAQSSIETQKEQIDNLEQENLTLEAEKHQVEIKLQEASANLKALQKEKIQLENTLKEIQAKLSLAELDVEKKKEIIETLTKEQEQLKKEHLQVSTRWSEASTQLQETSQQLKSQILTKTTQIDNLTTTLTESQKTYEQSQACLAKTTNDMDALTRRLEENEQQQKDLENTHAERIAQLEQAKKDLTKQIEQLNHQHLGEKELFNTTLEKTTTELSAAQSSIETQKEQIGNLEQENLTLEADKQQVEIKLQKASANLEALQTEKIQLENTLKEVQAKLSLAESKIEKDIKEHLQASTRWSEASTQLQENSQQLLEKTSNEQKEQLKALAKRLEEKEQERKALEQKLLEAQNKQENLEKIHAERVAEIQISTDDLNHQIKTLTQEKITLEADKKEIEKAIQTASTSFATLQKEKTAEIEILANDLAKYKQLKKNLEKTIIDQKEQLATLENKLSKQTSDHEKELQKSQTINKEKIDTLHTQITLLEKNIEENNNRHQQILIERENAMAELNKQITAQEVSLNEKNATIDQCQLLINNYKIQIDKIKEENNNLTQQIDKKTEELHMSANKQEECENNLFNSQRELSALTIKCDNTRKELEELKKEKITLEQTNIVESSQLAEARKHLHENSILLQNQKEKITSFEDAIKGLQWNLSTTKKDLTSKLAEKTNKVIFLETQLTQISKDIKKLNIEIANKTKLLEIEQTLLDSSRDDVKQQAIDLQTIRNKNEDITKQLHHLQQNQDETKQSLENTIVLLQSAKTEKIELEKQHLAEKKDWGKKYNELENKQDILTGQLSVLEELLKGKDTQIEALQQNLQKMNTSQTELKNELLGLTKVIKENDENYIKSAVQYEESQRNLNQAKKEIETNLLQIQQLERLVITEKNNLYSAQLTLDAKEKDISNLQQTLNSLTVKLQDSYDREALTKNELKKNQLELSTTLENINATQTELHNLKEAKEKIEKENRFTSTQLSETSLRLKNITNTMSSLESTLEKQQMILKQKESIITQLHENLAHNKESQKTLEIIIEKQRTDAISLKKELETMQLESTQTIAKHTSIIQNLEHLITQHKNRESTQQIEIQSLHSSVEKCKTQFRNQESARETLIQKNASLTFELQRVQNEKISLTYELNKLNASYTDLNTKNTELHADLLECQAELETAQSNFDDIKQKHATKEGTIDGLEEKLLEAETLNELLNKLHDETLSKFKQLEERCRALEIDIAKTEKEKEDQDKACSEMQETINAIKQSSKNLQEQLQDLETEKDKFESLYKELFKINTSDKKELKEKTQQIALINENLQSRQSLCASLKPHIIQLQKTIAPLADTNTPQASCIGELLAVINTQEEELVNYQALFSTLSETLIKLCQKKECKEISTQYDPPQEAISANNTVLTDIKTLPLSIQTGSLEIFLERGLHSEDTIIQSITILKKYTNINSNSLSSFNKEDEIVFNLAIFIVHAAPNYFNSEVQEAFTNWIIHKTAYVDVMHEHLQKKQETLLQICSNDNNQDLAQFVKNIRAALAHISRTRKELSIPTNEPSKIWCWASSLLNPHNSDTSELQLAFAGFLKKILARIEYQTSLIDPTQSTSNGKLRYIQTAYDLLNKTTNLPSIHYANPSHKPAYFTGAQPSTEVWEKWQIVSKAKELEIIEVIREAIITFACNQELNYIYVSGYDKIISPPTITCKPNTLLSELEEYTKPSCKFLIENASNYIQEIEQEISSRLSLLTGLSEPSSCSSFLKKFETQLFNSENALDNVIHLLTQKPQEYLIFSKLIYYRSALMNWKRSDKPEFASPDEWMWLVDAQCPRSNTGALRSSEEIDKIHGNTLLIVTKHFREHPKLNGSPLTSLQVSEWAKNIAHFILYKKEAFLFAETGSGKTETFAYVWKLIKTIFYQSPKKPPKIHYFSPLASSTFASLPTSNINYHLITKPDLNLTEYIVPKEDVRVIIDEFHLYSIHGTFPCFGITASPVPCFIPAKLQTPYFEQMYKRFQAQLQSSNDQLRATQMKSDTNKLHTLCKAHQQRIDKALKELDTSKLQFVNSWWTTDARGEAKISIDLQKIWNRCVELSTKASNQLNKNEPLDNPKLQENCFIAVQKALNGIIIYIKNSTKHRFSNSYNSSKLNATNIKNNPLLNYSSLNNSRSNTDLRKRHRPNQLSGVITPTLEPVDTSIDSQNSQITYPIEPSRSHKKNNSTYTLPETVDYNSIIPNHLLNTTSPKNLIEIITPKQVDDINNIIVKIINAVSDLELLYQQNTLTIELNQNEDPLAPIIQKLNQQVLYIQKKYHHFTHMMDAFKKLSGKATLTTTDYKECGFTDEQSYTMGLDAKRSALFEKTEFTQSMSKIIHSFSWESVAQEIQPKLASLQTPLPAAKIQIIMPLVHLKSKDMEPNLLLPLVKLFKQPNKDVYVLYNDSCEGSPTKGQACLISYSYKGSQICMTKYNDWRSTLDTLKKLDADSYTLLELFDCTNQQGGDFERFSIASENSPIIQFLLYTIQSDISAEIRLIAPTINDLFQALKRARCLKEKDSAYVYSYVITPTPPTEFIAKAEANQSKIEQVTREKVAVNKIARYTLKIMHLKKNPETSLTGRHIPSEELILPAEFPKVEITNLPHLILLQVQGNQQMMALPAPQATLWKAVERYTQAIDPYTTTDNTSQRSLVSHRNYNPIGIQNEQPTTIQESIRAPTNLLEQEILLKKIELYYEWIKGILPNTPSPLPTSRMINPSHATKISNTRMALQMMPTPGGPLTRNNAPQNRSHNRRTVSQQPVNQG